jgi:hypothetical protein
VISLDIIEFCEKYCGFKLYWYQKIYLKLIAKLPHPIIYRNMTARQQEQAIYEVLSKVYDKM